MIAETVPGLTALLVAFPPEWDALLPLVDDPVERAINGWSAVSGRLAGQPIVLAHTGLSMVNAAMNAQAVVDRFAPSRIVVSGIGGGVDPSLAIGDVAVPSRWGQFLEVAMATPGRALPSIPGETDLPAYGMLQPRDVLAGNADAPIAARRWFECDPDLLAIAATLNARDECRLVVGGNGISGSAFVDHAEYRRYLFDTFGAAVLDMETAAIAQVAFVNRVPFIAFRSVSDLAGGDEDANRISDFMDHAAGNAARVAKAFVAALPA